jgi:hypothetical protein
MIRCTHSAAAVPCFGVQDCGDGTFLALKNCPGCRSTIAAPMPAIVVTARGIVAWVRARVETRRAA